MSSLSRSRATTWSTSRLSMTWPMVRSSPALSTIRITQPFEARALEGVADQLLNAWAVQRTRDELVDARTVQDLCDEPLGAGAPDQPSRDLRQLGALEHAGGQVLDAPADKDAVCEAVGHAGAQQLLGDALDDRVADQVACRRFDQRPAHRLSDRVLGERALEHAVNRSLRVRRSDHDIQDGQRGAADDVTRAPPCGALYTHADSDGRCDRPEHRADRTRREARGHGERRRGASLVARRRERRSGHFRSVRGGVPRVGRAGFPSVSGLGR